MYAGNEGKNNMDIHELKEIAVKAGQQGVIDIKKQMKGLD